MSCPQCHDLGWVLDGDVSKSPLALELLACPLPDCKASARRIMLLSVNQAGFDIVTQPPFGDRVLSLLSRPPVDTP